MMKNERGHAMRMRERGGGNMRKNNHWEDQGLDGRILLKWILKLNRQVLKTDLSA